MSFAPAIAACGHVGVSGPSVMLCAMAARLSVSEHATVPRELTRRSVPARANPPSRRRATRSVAKTVSIKRR